MTWACPVCDWRGDAGRLDQRRINAGTSEAWGQVAPMYEYADLCPQCGCDGVHEVAQDNEGDS